MIGLVGYYLMSPFNIAFIAGNVIDNISFVLLAKVGVCGLACFWYLTSHTKKEAKGIFLIFLSTAYALSGYMIAYSFNLMWLDGVIFAPLVCFGIDRLIRRDNPVWYIVFMGISIIVNYYVGCMVGIYSALYFVWEFLKENSNLQNIKKEKGKIGKFLLSAILALGIASIILIPVLKDLSGTRANFSYKEVLDTETICSVQGIFSRLFCGSYQESDQKTNGNPNIYVSIFVFLLAVIYFANPQERKRNKALTGIFLAIFIFSFISMGINWIWHGFNQPANFPHRFAFLFTLLAVTIAAETLQKLPERLEIKTVAIPGILLILTCIVLGYLGLLETSWVILNIGIILFYLILLPQRFSEVAQILLGGLIVIEIIFNSCNILQQVEFDSRQETKEEIQQVQEGIDALKEKQEEKKNQGEFMRIEKTFETYDNDSMLYNYIGISHYSSNTRGSTINLYRYTGFHQNWLEIHYQHGNTVFGDSFLNIGYVLDKKENTNSNYPVIQEKDEFVIRQNSSVFPLSYLVTEDIKEISFKDKTIAENQNQIYQAISGKDDDILTVIPIQNRSLKNIRIRDLNGLNIYQYYAENLAEEASITYQLKTEKTGPVYFWTDNYGQLKVDIYVNGELCISNADREYATYRLGEFEPGEEIDVKIVLKDSLIFYHSVSFFQEDVSKTEELKNQLQPLKIQELKDGKMKGNITVTDEKAVLYLGIPYDKGWTVKVDGQTVEKIRVLEDQMVIDLENGEHEIEMTFFPEGLKQGILLSCIAIICTIALGIDSLLLEKGRKKEYNRLK